MYFSDTMFRLKIKIIKILSFLKFFCKIFLDIRQKCDLNQGKTEPSFIIRTPGEDGFKPGTC